jgi:transferase CAF17, mitochondrial
MSQNSALQAMTSAPKLLRRALSSLKFRLSTPVRPAFYICNRCLAQPGARLFSASSGRRSALSTNPSRSASSGLASLSSRRLISVSGPDATKYLHGVITSSFGSPGVLGSGGRGGFYTAFLNAQGRVLHDVFIYPDSIGLGTGTTTRSEESFLIEVDAAEAERLQRHIKRYKLRAKLDVRLLSQEEATVWHAWDDSEKSGLVSVLGKAHEDTILLDDTRTPNLGLRAITHRDATPHIDLEHVPEKAYQIRRYLHGVPEGQQEILFEHALPLDSNMDVMGGIDFHKGCYVGQELTIRTKHRGVVRKRILPVALYGDDQPVPSTLEYKPSVFPEDRGPDVFGAEMMPADSSIGRAEKKGRSAGKWLRGIGNIGLALIRLEVMTDLTLPGETPARAFRTEDEFVLQDKSREDEHVGQPIRVRAFVPDWLRQGLEVGQGRTTKSAYNTVD